MSDDDEHQDMEEGDEEQVPAQVADLAEASTPKSVRGMRACKRCGILKTLDQFMDEGCENCPFLEMVSARVCKKAGSNEDMSFLSRSY